MFVHSGFEVLVFLLHLLKTFIQLDILLHLRINTSLIYRSKQGKMLPLKKYIILKQNI